MKAIIYPQNTGSLGVVYPAQDTDINEIVKTVLPQGTPFKIVENLKIDVVFFEAYEFTVNGPKINIQKAHEIWKNKLRQARNKKLQMLDIDFMKAIEDNNSEKQTEIALQKQKLRNITNVTLPKELNDIKNYWPAELQ